MIKLFPPSPAAEGSGDAQAGTGVLADRAAIRVAVAAEERPTPADRPWLYTNMVASADGGTAVDGLSGQLGGPADMMMFGALRAVADVIVVGAATARQEQYRPPNLSDEVVEERRSRDQSPHPRLAVVTRSLSLDPELPLFDDPSNRPIILTAESASPERRAAVEPLADVINAGDDGVNLGEGLRQLRRLGFNNALSEGGPSINGQLVADGLVDEWNLSLSPALLGGDSRRAAFGPVPAGPPRSMKLARVWTDDDLLFCRWVRSPDDGADLD